MRLNRSTVEDVLGPIGEDKQGKLDLRARTPQLLRSLAGQMRSCLDLKGGIRSGVVVEESGLAAPLRAMSYRTAGRQGDGRLDPIMKFGSEGSGGCVVQGPTK